MEDWPERLLGIDGERRELLLELVVAVLMCFLRCSYSCACYDTTLFVYTAAFPNYMSSSLHRSQHYVAFGWAARSMTSVLHHGRAPAFPSFISMVDLNGR